MSGTLPSVEVRRAHERSPSPREHQRNYWFLQDVAHKFPATTLWSVTHKRWLWCNKPPPCARVTLLFSYEAYTHLHTLWVLMGLRPSAVRPQESRQKSSDVKPRGPLEGVNVPREHAHMGDRLRSVGAPEPMIGLRKISKSHRLRNTSGKPAFVDVRSRCFHVGEAGGCGWSLPALLVFQSTRNFCSERRARFWCLWLQSRNFPMTLNAA